MIDGSGVENFICGVGFPIAMCCYLLWRDSNIMKNMTESLDKNTAALQQLVNVIKKQ